MWPVRSTTALAFAEAFYRHLVTDEQSLATASLNARRETREADADPTWLAYTVFGSPSAVVSHHR